MPPRATASQGRHARRTSLCWARYDMPNARHALSGLARAAVSGRDGETPGPARHLVASVCALSEAEALGAGYLSDCESQSISKRN